MNNLHTHTHETVHSNCKTLTSNKSIIELAKSIKNTREDIKNLQFEESEFKKDLSAEINDAEVVIGKDGHVILTWYVNEIHRFDVDSFKKDNPKMYEKYLRTTTDRRLLIK